MSEKLASFSPEWVSPPGDTISDLLEERAWTQAEFAERTGFTTKHISLLINGKAPITEETALKLERVLGSTARFWLTREAQYREALAREEETHALVASIPWLQELPLGDMIRFGWVSRAASKVMQVAECLKFFGVADVDAWRVRYAEPIAAFRSSKSFSKNEGAVAAWIRQGERAAEAIACRPFDKVLCRALLDQARELTNLSDPSDFVPNLVKQCSQVGVALVFEPAPKGCPVSGATKWLTTEKALLMLSLRHRTNDHLWFSFFHEMAHLILHGKRMMFIDVEGMLDDDHEAEADQFAGDTLIPPKVAAQLRFVRPIEKEVDEFARSIGIAPGIVVGRMQRDGLVAWTHLNRLKIKYAWTQQGLLD